MNKNNRKQILYEEAFKLFLLKQYDGVSLKDIEKATKMTRGAIFYYHKNKLELFNGVVKHFFIEKQKAQIKIPYEDITLKEFINEYVNAVERQMQSMKNLIDDLSPTSASKAYIMLALKLREYSEELNHEYTSIRNKVLTNWIAAIQKAIDRGEVIQTLEALTMAEIFVSIYWGLSIQESFLSGLDPEHLRYKFMYLYDLIKKESE